MKTLKMKSILRWMFLFALAGGLLSDIGWGEASLFQGKEGSLRNEPALIITSLAPSQAFNSGIIQYSISGEGFPDHVGVKLVQNQLEIPGLYSKVETGTQIQCFFDLGGKPFGDYDLVLTTANGERYTFRGAFQIRIFVLVYEINARMKPVFFDYNQYNIREDQLFFLQENIQLLLANPYYYILLEGYTDPQGSRESNLELSVKRVESVRRMLVEAGIPESRIFTCHHPSKSDSLTGSKENNWGAARRVEVRLSETPPYKGD